MIHILIATNRPNSNSSKVAQVVEKHFQSQNEDVKIVDLSKVGLQDYDGCYTKEKPKAMADTIAELNSSDGFFIVCPEYNGSYPGAFKYFIDCWEYPTTFEYKPTAFIGIGGRFGGLRPVEHLQGVFGYRNSFMYPERVFIRNVWDECADNGLKDEGLNEMVKNQVSGFCTFIKALKEFKLHPSTR